MSLIQNFEKFLSTKQIVPESRINFYISWVTQCLAFLDKPENDEIRPVDIDRFLNHLAKIKEDWQVKQAKEAIGLYEYFKTNDIIQKPSPEILTDDQWKTAAKRLTNYLRLKHRSLSTEKTYLGWLRLFYRYVKGTRPSELDSMHVQNFLTYLAVEKKISPSTQNQAFNALLFFFRHVLNKDLDDISRVVRAHRKSRIPVVLNRREVLELFQYLDGTALLMARLIYGTGLRLQECLNLRIKDIDFDTNVLTVKSGKGDKDRLTILPENIKRDLIAHLDEVRKSFDVDRQNDVPGVFLPHALERKYPNAGKEWGWQWVFPSKTLSIDPRTQILRRHHLYPNVLQRKIREAAQKAKLAKHVSVHTLRHSFATHMLENGYDIRTIQDLLGHVSVQTTMIYTHVATKNRLGVKSPLDSIRTETV
jgi:integron integrase